MALLNPVHAFIVPFLFVVTVPLALFASITTMLAFSVLFLRVIVVYLDVALSLLPHSLHRRGPYHLQPSKSGSSITISRSPSPTLPRHRRRRRSSVTSVVSGGSATSLTERGLGLMPSVGPGRDYEGIGGWRVGRAGDDDDDVWTMVNPRIDLPDRQHGRLHHNRSLSGGPGLPGDGGYLMMKARARSPEAAMKLALPNSSKARTPPVARSAFSYGDSYFPSAISSSSPKAVRRLPVPASGE